MCDTMVVPASFTANGHVFFAKNSDRHPNEAQYIQILPAMDHPAGSRVTCTYIDIPQVEHTYKVLLSRPFWMWGCEMGANENGVVIGNEAVFTRVPYEKKGGLLGMDLIRLALERAEDAEAAVGIIIRLLEEFGQGGNAGHGHPFYYHNSFMIVDPRSSWVLETAGKHWAAKKITGIYAISNALTISNDYDLASNGLVANALEKGWTKSKESFDFARDYSDKIYTKFSAAHYRRGCAMDTLQNAKSAIDLRNMFAALRSHGMTSQAYKPERGLTGATVCMHAGFGPIRESQSVASMVADISPQGITFWLTGTSAPCTSIFKPVWLEAGCPEEAILPQGKYDRVSSYWQHELVHRSLLKNYSRNYEKVKSALAELEEKFIINSAGVGKETNEMKYEFTRQAFFESLQVDRELFALLQREKTPPTGYLYQQAWKKFNQEAEIDRLIN